MAHDELLPVRPRRRARACARSCSGCAWSAENVPPSGAYIVAPSHRFARIGGWYRRKLGEHSRTGAKQAGQSPLPGGKVALSVAILLALIFSKYIYLASLTSYYTFYLIQKFGVSVRSAQVLLFVFLGAVAAGTIAGGPIGDKIGRKYVIWCSILGVLPFSLMLPYANLFWTAILTVIIGLVLASAFSAILVYAQELMPGKVGMISGLFFGFAFGMGGLWSRRARQARGPNQHSTRLPGLFFPADDRAAHRLSAGCEQIEALAFRWLFGAPRAGLAFASKLLIDRDEARPFASMARICSAGRPW